MVVTWNSFINPIFWISVWTARVVIFDKILTNFSFFLTSIDNHLSHFLLRILYWDVLCSIVLARIFFIDISTETKFYILFLQKAVAKFLGVPKYIVDYYTHKFTILPSELIGYFDNRLKWVIKVKIKIVTNLISFFWNSEAKFSGVRYVFWILKC